MSDIILEMKNIVKEFPGVKALNNVNLKVKKGDIHALVGENGAGKSTLMNVLSGVYPHGSYTGDIIYNSEICNFKNIKDSEKVGIVIIHQELALIPYLSIAENIFLGNERAKGIVISWQETEKKAKELLERVGLDENPNTLIKDIGVGKQQLVEIAKALSKDVKLLILDEPTAALNDDDSENLLQLLLDIKKQGITSIIISHKLNEIEKVADEITIIRDGATIETLDKNTDDISQARIVKGMVGRDMSARFPEREKNIGEIFFEVKNLTSFHPLYEERYVVNDASMNVRKGEIVGIAGLMGSGRTELAMAIFGKSYGQKITGKTFINSKEVSLSSVPKAIEYGVAYLTEDRKDAGLILIENIKHNVSMASLKKVSKGIVIDDNSESLIAEEYRKKLNIKTPSIYQKTVNLSGGNQQKVVLSRWLFADPDLLILDEPTRGIDVGAKYEIYSIINDIVAQGKSIIFISSELEELLGMCDRIYVMNEAKIVGELDIEDASQESIMNIIMHSNNKVDAI